MYVLVVEDHEPSRILLSRFLGRCGYEVVVAGNFQTAVTFLENFRFDALVSDLGLPDQDGLGLAAEARKKHPVILTVAVTARCEVNDRVKAREAGYDHFLTKPFDFHILRSLLVGAA